MGRYLFVSIVILSLLIPLSCTTTSTKDRGSLSDAMDKARDDYPEERELPSEPRNNDEWDREDDRDYYEDDWEDDQDGEYVYYTGPTAMYLGARGGNALYSYPYFDSLFDSELLLGTGLEKTEFLFFGGIKAVTAREDSAIKDSIDEGVIFLRGGVEGRYYPFPSWPVFSPYLLAQAGGLYMYWSFKNPLDAGSETITSDSVGGMILAAGAGINLINTDTFRLGAAWIPEVHFFYSETHEGFENDVFDAYSTIRWAIEMGLTVD